MRKLFKWMIAAFLIMMGLLFLISRHTIVRKKPMALKSEKVSNHLIEEKSPYLLQHAYNPVNWYPWGSEAFEKSRRENKPIFLSIGYSTCHWCHVMEEESFENQSVADALNEHFVSIKVDREERPDVDGIYMKAVMAMTGSGGWPMSVFLTPDLEPFYGGTYFPPDERYGRPGFLTILNTIANQWKTEKDHMVLAGRKLAEAIRSDSEGKNVGAIRESPLPNERTLKTAFHQFESQYDHQLGGFGGAPKFPRSHVMSFLLRYWKRTQNQEALEMSVKTLREMAKGGMYDHVGGGFHRYSTDAKWHIPHFEKMLYDQALIAKTYLEAYQGIHDETFASVAREVFDYVLRDMTSQEGAFYSAEDADSFELRSPSGTGTKREGAFYIWSEEEITSLLGVEKSKIFNYAFGVESNGNAKRDQFGEFTGKNILYLANASDEVSKKFGKSKPEIEKIIQESKSVLFQARSKRPRPHLDDKILTDWNGLMISALAFGSRVLNEPRYAGAAKKSADFILKKMKSQPGRLMHRYRDGEVAVTGFLDDYAFFTNGLIDLYEATFDPYYLKEAVFLAGEMKRLFWDEKNDGFFFSAKDGEALIASSKEIYDGAIPSGNSFAALVLLKLGRMTMNEGFAKQAQSILDAFSPQVAQFPSGYPQMLMALDFALGPSQEIVIAGDKKSAEAKKMADIVFKEFLPNKVVIFHSSNPSEASEIEMIAPFVKSQKMINGKTAVYVCQDFTCALPVTDEAALKNQLGIKL